MPSLLPRQTAKLLAVSLLLLAAAGCEAGDGHSLRLFTGHTLAARAEPARIQQEPDENHHRLHVHLRGPEREAALVLHTGASSSL